MITKKVNIITIPEDKIVSIEVSGTFYKRLQTVFHDYYSRYSPEQIIEHLKLIDQQKTTNDPNAYNFETLLILLHEIEKVFEENDLTEEEEIEIEVPEEKDKEKPNES